MRAPGERRGAAGGCGIAWWGAVCVVANLLSRFGLALVARRLPLGDDERLPVEPGRARLHQHLARGQAQAVHVPPRIHIVQCVHDLFHVVGVK